MQPSSIVSQSVLGAKLLSQALESVSTNLSSAVPPKEPITVETTDVSNKLQVTKDEHLSNSPPDATKVICTQEQKIDRPSVEDNPINVDIQAVNSPVQQTIDGKKIIYLFYPSATDMN